MGRGAVWVARLAFALVFVINVRCALGYVVYPAAHLGDFGLTGVAGEAALRGLGVAFLMWNATYPLAMANPVRYAPVAVIVLVQQTIGLVGETLIYATVPPEYSQMLAGIRAFIAFDAFGLLVMLLAFTRMVAVLRRERRAGIVHADLTGERAGSASAGGACGDERADGL